MNWWVGEVFLQPINGPHSKDQFLPCSGYLLPCDNTATNAALKSMHIHSLIVSIRRSLSGAWLGSLLQGLTKFEVKVLVGPVVSSEAGLGSTSKLWLLVEFSSLQGLKTLLSCQLLARGCPACLATWPPMWAAHDMTS